MDKVSNTNCRVQRFGSIGGTNEPSGARERAWLIIKERGRTIACEVRKVRIHPRALCGLREEDAHEVGELLKWA